LNAIAVGRDTPRTLLVADNQSVFRSTDGGRTWTAPLTRCLLASALAVDPRSARRLYAGCQVGVLASTDGGATWSPFGSGLYARSFNERPFDPADPLRLYAATGAAGLFELDFPR